MSDLKSSGPYRATKLWNEIVLAFRNGMPVKRHRRHIKVYDNCFSGVEAVNWLHAVLERNPNFGPRINKEQIIQLLNKFLKAGVFESVGTSSPTDHQFKENGDLYQFCSRSLSSCNLRLPLLTSTNVQRKQQVMAKSKSRTNSSVSKRLDGCSSGNHAVHCNSRERNSVCINKPSAYSRILSNAHHENSSSKNRLPENASHGIKDTITSISQRRQRSTENENIENIIPSMIHSATNSTLKHSQSVNVNGLKKHSNTLHGCMNECHTSAWEPVSVPFNARHEPCDVYQQRNIHELHSHAKPVKCAFSKNSGSSISHECSDVLNVKESKFSCGLPNSDLPQQFVFSVLQDGSANMVEKEVKPLQETVIQEECSQLHTGNRYSTEKNLTCDASRKHFTLGHGQQKCGFSLSHQSSHSSINIPVSDYVTKHNQAYLEMGYRHNYFSHKGWKDASPVNSTQMGLLDREDVSSFERVCNGECVEQGLFNDRTSQDGSNCTQAPYRKCTSQDDGRTEMKARWKMLVVSRIQELLIGMENVLALLPVNVPVDWVIKNASEEEQVLSQCPQQFVAVISHLEHWHESQNEEIMYALKNYFYNLNEPLTTFDLYNALTQTFLYVEHINKVQNLDFHLNDVPSKCSLENLTTDIQSSCTSQANPALEKGHLSDLGSLINSNMLLTTILPPNSCFETAFTSDVPVTRIVPQRTMDSLHFSRKTVVPESCRSVGPQESISSRNSDNVTYSGFNVDGSNLPVKQNGIATSTHCTQPRADSFRCIEPGSKITRKGKYSLRASKKPSGKKVEKYRLQQCSDWSGGYVNLALSQSFDEAETDLTSQELDYAAAMEALNKLMQCSRNVPEVASTDEGYPDASSEYSGSESGSYYTAVSSSTDNSCQSSEMHSVISERKLAYADQWTQHGVNLGIAVLQLLLLFIPPSSRIQLWYLLQFLKQVASVHMANWESIEFAMPFTRSILRSRNESDYDSALAHRVANFLILHSDEIFQVPATLKVHMQMEQQSALARLTYCEQVSCEQFEQQRQTGSQLALSELLEQIIADRKMGQKEKKKHMRMFKEAYPHIYHRRFPESNKQDKSGDKSRAFLHFPVLTKLKSLRV